MKDYSKWLKDTEAAEIIGCSTKTLRKFAQENIINTGKYQNPTTGAWQTRYDPEDAKRISKGDRTPHSRPLDLPRSPQTALQRAAPAAGQSIAQALLERLSAPQGEKNGILKPSELQYKLYLNAEEAVAYTGLSITEIRRGINGKGHGPNSNSRRGPVQSEVFRRRDLEAL